MKKDLVHPHVHLPEHQVKNQGRVRDRDHDQDQDRLQNLRLVLDRPPRLDLSVQFLDLNDLCLGLHLDRHRKVDRSLDPVHNPGYDLDRNPNLDRVRDRDRELLNLERLRSQDHLPGPDQNLGQDHHRLLSQDHSRLQDLRHIHLLSRGHNLGHHQDPLRNPGLHPGLLVEVAAEVAAKVAKVVPKQNRILIIRNLYLIIFIAAFFTECFRILLSKILTLTSQKVTRLGIL